MCGEWILCQREANHVLFGGFEESCFCNRSCPVLFRFPNGLVPRDREKRGGSVAWCGVCQPRVGRKNVLLTNEVSSDDGLASWLF